MVEELWQDGKLVKLGAAKILLFTNKGNEYQAIRFTNSRDVTAYYDSDGVSRESPFLRSPLAFSESLPIFNPKDFTLSTKKCDPTTVPISVQKPVHPSVCVSDGVVTYAGRNGGHGNFVKVKHMSPYETSYSHLSKINVKKGQRVKKGQDHRKSGNNWCINRSSSSLSSLEEQTLCRCDESQVSKRERSCLAVTTLHSNNKRRCLDRVRTIKASRQCQQKDID